MAELRVLVSDPLFLSVIQTATIVITAIYVYLTYKMSREMRNQRLDTAQPVITLWLDPNTDEYGAGKCLVRNIGSGPAFDIRISLYGDPPSYRAINPLPALASREEDTIWLLPAIPLDFAFSDVQLPASYRGIQVEAVYRDLFGQGWQTRRTVGMLVDRGGSGDEGQPLRVLWADQSQQTIHRLPKVRWWHRRSRCNAQTVT